MDRAAIEREIRAAFRGVSLGNGIGLWEAQAIDDYQSDEVRREERKRDQKEDWSLIGHADLQRCHSSLCFFDSDGMRFHLPAFIVGSLRNELDDPIFHLTHLDEFARSKLTSLNQTQRNAIVSYLKWCLEASEYKFEYPGIRKALNEYWERQT